MLLCYRVSAMEMLLHYRVNTTKTGVETQQKFLFFSEAKIPCKRSLLYARFHVDCPYQFIFNLNTSTAHSPTSECCSDF